MATRVNNLNELVGKYNANIDEDVRVMKNIERQAKNLQSTMDRLQERWEARSQKLMSRRLPTNEKLWIAHDWSDVLS